MGLAFLEKLLGRKIHAPTREELEVFRELEELAKQKITTYVAYQTASGVKALEAIRRFVQELCSGLGGRFKQEESAGEIVYACRLEKPVLLRELMINVDVSKGEMKLMLEVQRIGQEKVFERAELRLEHAPFNPNAMVITGAGSPSFYSAGFALNRGIGHLFMSRERALEINEIVVRVKKQNDKIETIFIELSPFQGIAEIKLKPPLPPPPIAEY